MTDRTIEHEHAGCGGTILVGGKGPDKHEYCDRCGAYRYANDGDEGFPTGHDRAANRGAWDTGCERSPEEDAASRRRNGEGMIDTGLGKVRIRRSTIPGSSAYQVRWNAGPLSRIGAAGYCDLPDHASALRYAADRATKFGLVVVDETGDEGERA